MTDIQLLPLERSDRERFIRDNQEAFNYGALEEFGRRDDHVASEERLESVDIFETAMKNCFAAGRVLIDAVLAGDL
jgi:hypothetical protein